MPFFPISPDFLKISLSIIVLLLILSTIYLRRLLNSSPKTEKLYDLEQDEYDFLGSADGIPSNIDLAHAYIAMGDTEKAKEILIQIAQVDNPKYSKQAQSILDEL